MFFVFLSNSVQISAESLNIDAEACILIDSKTGQVLYEQNADKKGLYPASTTKIMTAIIALENGDLNQMMTASQAAVNDIGKDGMNIGIIPGEEISMEYLLHALLISSANETANIIAENICPSRQEFIDMMNRKANDLGAVNTHFVNPCGAHDPNHYTTARDMAIIAQHAMTIPQFREIVSKKEYRIQPTNKHNEWPVLASTNNLMKWDKSTLYSVNGIKTGFTSPAGYCLVSSASDDTSMELIAVVMGVKNQGGRENIVKYSRQLLEYGFNNYEIRNIVNADQIIKTVPVIDAENNASVSLAARDDLSCIIPKDNSTQSITANEYLKTDIETPVNKGDIMGYIEYESNGIKLGKVTVIAADSVSQAAKAKVVASAKDVVKNSVFKKVIIFIVISLLSFLVLRFTLRTISRNINSKKL